MTRIPCHGLVLTLASSAAAFAQSTWIEQPTIPAGATTSAYHEVRERIVLFAESAEIRVVAPS